MEYGKVIHGSFVSRPNRFIAVVNVAGEDILCHVKNTGRCKELLIPGADVILCQAENPNRKTQYDLVSVYKGKRLINMDSQAPNKIAGEFLPCLFPEIQRLRSEVTYGDSRFDFHAVTSSGEMFIEVKGVTLEKDGVVLFPDAPTVRGVKHLNGLINAVKNGYRAVALFVIQMDNVEYFTPNMETHPEFAMALDRAKSSGVEIYAVSCKVSEKEITAAALVRTVIPNIGLE